MPKYRVQIDGRNFLIDIDGEVTKRGFITFRYVEADDPDFEQLARIPGNATHRADFPVIIEQRDVAFSGAVELDNPRNSEARLKARPDIGIERLALGHELDARRLDQLDEFILAHLAPRNGDDVAVRRQPVRRIAPRKCLWTAMTSIVLMPGEPGSNALLVGVTV